MNARFKTTLIQNGTTQKGIALIKKLLDENASLSAQIKNKILCVDFPENKFKIKEFLAFEEFVFYPLSKIASPDINADIDAVFICSDKKE